MDFVVVTASFIKYIKKVISLWERFESTRPVNFVSFVVSDSFIVFVLCAERMGVGKSTTCVLAGENRLVFD